MKKILFIIGFLGALLSANAQISTVSKIIVKNPTIITETDTIVAPIFGTNEFGKIAISDLGLATSDDLYNYVHKDSVQYHVGISNSDPGKEFATIVGIDVSGNPYWRTNGYQVTNTAASNSLPKRNGSGQIEVNAGTDPSHAVNVGQLADKADKSTTLTAGTWLQGSGDLSANRTFNVVPTVNAWLLDAQGNERILLGNETNPTNGVIFRASSASADLLQLRNPGNTALFRVNSSGELTTGSVPWGRITGAPDILTENEAITQGINSNAGDLPSSTVNLDSASGNNVFYRTGVAVVHNYTHSGGYKQQLLYRFDNGGALRYRGFNPSLGWTNLSTVWDDNNLPDPASQADLSPMYPLGYAAASTNYGGAVTEDINTLTGNFVGAISSSAPNKPGAGTLWAWQLFGATSGFRLMGSTGVNGELFIQRYNSSAWQTPIKVATEDYVNSQGFLTSPGTLQEVTEQGATTDVATTFTDDVTIGTQGATNFNVHGHAVFNDTFNVLGEATVQDAVNINNPLTGGNAGFGMFWDGTNSKIRWGEAKIVSPNEWTVLPMDTGQIVAIGDPVEDGNSANLYVQKAADAGSVRFDSGLYSSRRSILSVGASDATSGWLLARTESTNQTRIQSLTTPNSGISVMDGIQEIGMRYSANYAVNNISNPRWIPDKEYVDNAIAFPPVSGWENITVSGDATATTARVRRKLNVVEVQIEEYVRNTGGLLIPAGFRPTGITHFFWGVATVSGTLTPVPMAVTTVGEIILVDTGHSSEAVTVTYQFTVM